MELLYYVALPYTEEILNLVTLFSIDVSKQDIDDGDYTRDLGLFIYRTRLELETIDDDSEWLLDTDDALHVLAFYANKDFNGLCAYLNTIRKRPFDVYTNSNYFT